MPEFILNTEGAETEFAALDTFTQGYIEAMFFTETSPLSEDDWRDEYESGSADGSWPSEYGVADLAPSALAKIKAECAEYQAKFADLLARAYDVGRDLRRGAYDEAAAGRDLWYDRNGHGFGASDRGLGEVGRELGNAGDSFPTCEPYLGDDGRIYISGAETFTPTTAES